MTDRLFGETPELAERDFSADRELDSGLLKAKLEHRIRPLTRLLWREEKKIPTRTTFVRSSTTTIPRGARC